ncbi:unnamed protein product [Miscanthus lutarioriparius]|uniref:Transcription factor n=1 Tax=Miscanthus lutarioriparius TaxID=422564 RepID=A0A811R4F7_9POAL|nr:unnamed protein product [Miscanthus lutarioriparius]
MDKASVLADATTYIAHLRQRVGQLEVEAKQKAAAAALTTVAPSHSFSSSSSLGEKLEVRMVGTEAAALRLTTTAAARHPPPARLMLALRSLDLTVPHSCVCLVGGMTVQTPSGNCPPRCGTTAPFAPRCSTGCSGPAS